MLVVSGASGVGKSTVARLVAAAFGRSVVLPVDDVMGWIASGRVDPSAPEAAAQNLAVGAAVAVSAMSFAMHGSTTLVDGHLFPEGVAGLAAACAARGLRCHYVVLRADLDTCWARAGMRGEGRWPLERDRFVALHERFADLHLTPRHVVDAERTPDAVAAAVLAAFAAGQLLWGTTAAHPV